MQNNPLPFKNAALETTTNKNVNAAICASLLETILWLKGENARLIPHGNGLIAVQGSRGTDNEAAKSVYDFLDEHKERGAIGLTSVDIVDGRAPPITALSGEPWPCIRICNGGKWICGMNTPDIAAGLADEVTKLSPCALQRVGDPAGDRAVANSSLMETRLLQEGLFSSESELYVENTSRISVTEPESEAGAKIVAFMGDLYRRFNEKYPDSKIEILENGTFLGEGLHDSKLTTFLAKDIASAARDHATPSNQKEPVLPTRKFKYRKVNNCPCTVCTPVN